LETSQRSYAVGYQAKVCGLTGGFIFPLFMAGASLGRGLAQIRGIPFISDVPPVLLAMSIATGAAHRQSSDVCFPTGPSPGMHKPPTLHGSKVLCSQHTYTAPQSFSMRMSTPVLLPRLVATSTAHCPSDRAV